MTVNVWTQLPGLRLRCVCPLLSAVHMRVDGFQGEARLSVFSSPDGLERSLGSKKPLSGEESALFPTLCPGEPVKRGIPYPGSPGPRDQGTQFEKLSLTWMQLF